MEARGIHRRISFVVTPALRERLQRKVHRKGDDDCWNWLGAVRNGYGAIKHETHILGTHVVAFVAAHGQIPEGRLVTHSCDNRLCCNPKHLTAGTFADNVRDMSRLGQYRVNGSAHPRARFTERDVRQMLALHLVLGYGAVRLGRIFDCKPSAVDKILQRTSWKHVAYPSAGEAKEIIAAMQLKTETA